MVTADIVACYQVLTEILPFGSAHDGVITSHILAGNRPPRTQNARWLRHQIWNMITTCWSDKRELRWDIRAVHHQLSASSIQETAEVEREYQRSPPNCDTHRRYYLFPLSRDSKYSTKLYSIEDPPPPVVYPHPPLQSPSHHHAFPPSHPHPRCPLAWA